MSEKKYCNKPKAEIEEDVRSVINLSLNKLLRTEDLKGKLPTGTIS
jgi:hypothetical protein